MAVSGRGPGWIDPLWRGAFSYWRRHPVASLAIAGATLALAISISSAPLVVDAAADQSFEEAARAASIDARPGATLDARAYTVGLADAAAMAEVAETLDRIDVFGSPDVTVRPLRPYSGQPQPTRVVRFGGAESVAVLFAGGNRDQHLQLTDGASSGSRPGEVWLPDVVAAALGAGEGDRVELALEYRLGGGVDPDGVFVEVAGVYASDPASRPIATEGSWDPTELPRSPLDSTSPAALVIADPITAASLMQAMEDQPIVTWHLPWVGEVTLERGRQAAGSLQATVDLLVDRTSRIGRIVSEAEADRVVLSSGVGGFVDDAEQSVGILKPVIDSMSAAGLAISMIVVAVCAWLLGASRSRQRALALAMGQRPARLAATAVVELVPAVVAGVIGAAAIVVQAPSLLAGDGEIDRATRAQALRSVLWSAPIALGLIALVTLAAAVRADPTVGYRTRRLLAAARPETIALVAACVTGAQIARHSGSVLDSGVGLLFPLLAILAGALTVGRTLSFLLGHVGKGRASFAPPRWLAGWLVRRRLSLAMAQTSAVAIVVASGVGLFAYAFSVSGNGLEVLADKQAVLGGASATASVSGSEAVNGVTEFASPFPGATVVWATSNVHVGDSITSDLMMVEPESFADAVEWRDSYADAPLDELLGRLDTGERFTIAVVAAGRQAQSLPTEGVMSLGNDFNVRYRTVARVNALPWQRERSTMFLVSAPAIAPSIPNEDGSFPGPADTTGLDRVFRSYVWSSGDQSELDRSLDPGAVVQYQEMPLNLTSAGRIPEFVAFDHAMPYLRVIGISMLAVAAVALIVLSGRDPDGVALEAEFGARMGLPLRSVVSARIGAIVLLSALAAVAGLALGGATHSIMIERLDPAPQFNPTFSGSLRIYEAAGALGFVLIAATVASVLELRASRRRPITEVLRAVE